MQPKSTSEDDSTVLGDSTINELLREPIAPDDRRSDLRLGARSDDASKRETSEDLLAPEVLFPKETRDGEDDAS